MENRRIEQEMVTIDELARAAVEDFGAAADQAGLTLRAEIAPDIPKIRSDSIYMRRMLDNLIGNALKFTPAGGTVTVQMEQEDAQVIIRVSDTGIGIPLEEQERIFERFYQVNGSTRRHYGGVGLGLSLVKRICAHQGWQVGVVPRQPQGSCFQVRLHDSAV